MAPRHFDPRLNKKRVLSHADYTVCAVNALAVRNAARPDEEFGNFATRDEFPDLRKRQGATPLLAPGRRKLGKTDLPRLTGEAVFEFVLRTYVRK